MANEQTSVPLYAASEILTAANMNISAGTGVPVFATTVTRDAAFGGAGEKVLAEGQLCYLSSTNVVQYYDGAAWATVGPTSPGLVLVKAQTIGSAVTSVAVTGAFSTDYDNYKIMISGGAGSTNGSLQLQLGSTTTGYYNGFGGATFAGANDFGGYSNQANMQNVGRASTSTLYANVELVNPFLTKNTFVTYTWVVNETSGRARINGSYLNDSTSYTGFTIIVETGTVTGGTIAVYGYAKA
jgi:hypothetical protein